MSRKRINIIILLAILTLGAVVVTQIYWVRRAYNIQEQQFNTSVVSAMTTVVDRILEMNNDSAVVEPVQMQSNNFFIANINDTLHPYLLEALLREEFGRTDVRRPFEYGIYDCFTDSIVYGSRIAFDANDSLVRSEALGIQQRFNKDGHYFGVYYPSKTTLILGEMRFWAISSLLTFAVVIFFSYLVIMLLKQKRLSEVKTDFINNMTHELKTPISTIRLSAEVLKSEGISAQPDRLHQYARIIHQENERLQNQVDKVLQIATLSPEKVQLKQERLDVHDILRQLEEAFTVRLEAQNGAIATDLTAQAHHLTGDLVHITNILGNLLDNAAKYTQREPQISVDTSNPNPETLQIKVKDNGIGIEKKHQKLIFDQFFRVPTGNRHDVKGFGLGLYYVKTIVTAHNGTIDVSSTPGEGSTFTLQFKTTTV